VAVLRQQSWNAQQRADVPFLRAIESAVAADFDLLAGTILANRIPAIVSGFNLITSGVTQPGALQIQVAGSVLMHFYATDSGTIFQVDADRVNEVLSSTNPKIQGSFLPSQTNYIGLDFSRSNDPTTTDAVQFFDTDTNSEVTKSIPLARTIDYTIIISASDFDSNSGVCPLAKVALDANSTITSVQDARNILWRLGTGGSNPNTKNAYAWPGGRNEGASSDPFLGGDKAIGSMKSWMDAMMTRVWELGGGEYWYSPTVDHNVVMTRSGSPFSSTGEYFEWVGSNLHWQGLTVTFANSTGIYNDITNQTSNLAGTTDLADGECIYVDLDRTTTLTRGGSTSLGAQKTTLALLGSPAIPGSRWVIAWRYGSSVFVRDQSYAVGSAFKLATVAAAGTVKLSATDSVSATPPTVATVDSVSFVARAAGITRGFFPGMTTATPSDFFGGSGDITIGGGWDGADGHGGGNPVDHNVFIQTIRNQDVIYLSATGSFQGASVPSISAFIPYADSAEQSAAYLMQFAVGSVGSLRTVHAVFGDGSIGFVNIDDANISAGGLPPTPAPSGNFKVRSKLFTRTNQLSTPNTRDQLCWLQWDGDVHVIWESNPY